MFRSVFHALLGRFLSFKLLQFFILNYLCFLLSILVGFKTDQSVSRCLGPGTVEEIVAREGEELISRYLTCLPITK